MEFSAKQIANYLNGEVVGNHDAKVTTLSKIEEGVPGSLSFLSNEKYTPYIYSTQASIVIVNHDFTPEKEVLSTMVKVENAYSAFAQVLELYNQAKQTKAGIEQPVYISDSAILGEDIYLGAFAYIGSQAKIGKNSKIHPQCYIGENVQIGENCQLFPGVRILSDTVIGNNVTIHSGVVIGCDGFGFAPNNENSYNKIPQIGNVVIEDHVDIGSNCNIDRATMGSTIIRKGVKLDNLVQIAHNVEIGENTVIASQTGVAGSAKIGHNCMIGGQVGIVGHITIGNNVKIAAQSGVGNNIPDNDVIQGSPAYSKIKFLKDYVHFRRLTKMGKDINNLKKNLNNNE